MTAGPNTTIAPVEIGGKLVGPDQPVYVIAEIGLNHNGDVAIAKQLIDIAHEAGCDAVKFQKRTPEISTPKDMRDVMRETPWGTMTYLDYRYRVEFEEEQYTEIDNYCSKLGMHWFASPWDVPSVEFLANKFDVVTFKVASASLTDLELLSAMKATGKPVILSTGMSTLEEIDKAVETLGKDKLVMMHATSTYRCRPTRPTCARSPRCASGTACRSATRATSAACRSASRRSPWVRSPWSGTSPWTAPCGLGPLGLPGARRPASPGPGHPDHRGGPGRRRQARLRG